MQVLIRRVRAWAREFAALRERERKGDDRRGELGRDVRTLGHAGLWLAFVVVHVACSRPLGPPSVGSGDAHSTDSAGTPESSVGTGGSASHDSGGDSESNGVSPSDETDDGSGSLDPSSETARLGAHAIAFNIVNSDSPTLSTPPRNTRPTGSTMIVSVGRGDIGAFVLPTDNKGNTGYQQLGDVHPYTNWSLSGTALYGLPSFKGGNDHVITVTSPPVDEVTMAVAEIIGGTNIQDFAWNEVLAGTPLTSPSVTTTGPAVIVAFWWGDADVAYDKTAIPNNGFELLDAVLSEGALVQSAAAAKQVSHAGVYDVTWTATPFQGAQLWIVAVQ